MSPRAVGTALALALALSGTRASAYCRTRTCDFTDPNQNCRFDAEGCLTEDSGLPLFWAQGCVSFGVQERGSPLHGISYDEANRVAAESFAQWQYAACEGGGSPSIEIRGAGPIECAQPEYNQTAPNANIVMFQDETWPYTAEDLRPGDTLALTTVTFNVETGEIYDADVEVNSRESPPLIPNTADVGPGTIDLHSVLTHEFGHFLGLSHSKAAGATMQTSLVAGQTLLADLSTDDIAGVCAIYPPDRAITDNSCTPRHGFSRECAAEETGCCSTAPGARSSPTQSLALALAALGFILFGVRRRR